MLRYVLVVSEEDPVARAVSAGWTLGDRTEGAARAIGVRRLGPEVGVLRRPGLHIHEDGLAVPGERPEDDPPTLVFPSVHRSATETAALTVHPLGNPTAAAEVGGRPERLVATDPRLMTDALRRIAELGVRIGWPATFEATHHGPSLSQPAFFVEIGAPDFAHPPEETVAGFAGLLPELEGDPADRVAVGLGGGHYAPHFSDLAKERRWAFGHLLPRYVQATAPLGIVRAAVRASPGAEGVIYHRASDQEEWARFGPPARLRDNEAAVRSRRETTRGSPGGARSAGT